MRECFCFGSEAVNASGEAVRGLVNFTRSFAAHEILRGLFPRFAREGIRDLTQNTTATATRTSPNKSFKEQNNSYARAL